MHFLPRYTHRLKIYCMSLVKLFNNPDTNFQEHTPNTCAIFSCEITIDHLVNYNCVTPIDKDQTFT